MPKWSGCKQPGQRQLPTANAGCTHKQRPATDSTKSVNVDVRTTQARPALRQAIDFALGKSACRGTDVKLASASLCHVQRYERLEDA